MDVWMNRNRVTLGWIKREYSRDSRDEYEFEDSPRDGFGLGLVLVFDLDLVLVLDLDICICICMYTVYCTAVLYYYCNYCKNDLTALVDLMN